MKQDSRDLDLKSGAEGKLGVERGKTPTAKTPAQRPSQEAL
jgi:hypothetical protein